MKMMTAKRITKTMVTVLTVFVTLASNTAVAMCADGIFAGKGSDYEDVEHGKHGYSKQEWVEGDDSFGIVNVLEIVPDARMGFIGYTVGGCEPLGDTAEEKLWIMDGMANNSAGSENDSWKNPYYKDNFSAVSTSSDVPAMTYEYGYYTGYFKKVSPGCGVYAMGDVSYSGGKVSNVIMVSKFANSGNALSNNGKYDYVWVESDKDSEGKYKQSGLYTTESQLKAGDPIYVYDYKKTKYLNNEEFLTVVYPAKVKDGGTTYEADGVSGAYNTYSSTEMKSVNTNNKKAAELFKVATNSNGNKGVKIFTRTPAQLQLDENKSLIDNVDLIVMANSGDGTYEAALAAYKKRYEGTGLKTDSELNINKRDVYNSANDLSFDQIMTIYKRVVVEGDLAIACSHTCYTGNGNAQESNIWKLMFMLFLTNKAGDDNTIAGSGREMFKDFMAEYKSDAPVIARVRKDVNSSDGFTEIKASDLVRIEKDENGKGKFVVDSQYSGWFYEKISDIDGPDYVKWTFRNDDINASGTKWPKSIKDNWLLAWTNGDVYNKNGDQYNKSGYDNSSFPLYKYYYYGDPWNVANSKGKYTARYDVGFDGSFSRYQNQMIYLDSYTLFRVGTSGGAAQLKSIIKDTPKKKEPEPAGHYESVDLTAFMTMNILNGDSVNTDIGGNKIMYVNEYEIKPGGRLVSIPFNFEVRSTHPLDKMELYVDGIDDPIATYSFTTSGDEPFGNSAPSTLAYSYSTSKGGSGSGTLKKSADESGLTPPGPRNPDVVEGVDDKVWRYEGQINELTKSYFETSRNAKVYFKVYSTFELSDVEGPLSATDTITVVKREFFQLM